MQTKEIIGLIKGEIDYTEDTLCRLKNTVEEYPYFQAAQLLYTLNLQATRDSRFNDELRKTACLLGDRRNLFYRVKGDYFPSGWIEKLEWKDDPETESPFDKIEKFLAEQAKKEKNAVHQSLPSEEISTDYVSYGLSQTSDEAKTETTPLQHQDKIDKFLAEDEKAPVKIVLKNHPEEAFDMPFSDLDTVAEGSFFSETLAKIYLKQKKYEKAMEIIRKLYLLNPEKNRYFADQIRFLEKLVNNTKK